MPLCSKCFQEKPLLKIENKELCKDCAIDNRISKEKEETNKSNLIVVEEPKKKEKINESKRQEKGIIKIGSHHNIRNVELTFKRGGTNIIVGENDVGKTNILDFIYYKNEEWDELSYHPKREEEVGNLGVKMTYCYHSMPPIFGNKEIICSNSSLNADYKKTTNYSYSLYYLDLDIITQFLREYEESREIKIKRTRGFKLAPTFLSLDERQKMMIINVSKTNEDSLMLDYGADEKFSRRQINDLKEEVYIGRNKETLEPDHSIKYIGSGYIKKKKLDCLINNLFKQINERKRQTTKQEKIIEHLLLIDEPEVFLHPSFLGKVATSIKNLNEKGVTVILTTHLPAFLSHFIYEKKTNLVIAKKNKATEILSNNEILYFDKLRDEIKTDVLSYWKNYCTCFERRIIDDEKFYYNKWKSILNEHTLKVFFSAKVLFVEGPSDYILLTSEIIRKRVKGLEEIEIIPIFGKSNYIFFSKLAERLRLFYWTLLDIDKDNIDEKLLEELQTGKELNPSSHTINEAKENCSKQIDTRFLFQHIGELEFKKIKEDEMACSKRSKISWFPQNIEFFLNPEREERKKNKDAEYKFWNNHDWIRGKEREMITSISLNIFDKKRLDKLIKELNKIVESIKEQEKIDNFYEE